MQFPLLSSFFFSTPLQNYRLQLQPYTLRVIISHLVKNLPTYIVSASYIPSFT